MDKEKFEIWANLQETADALMYDVEMGLKRVFDKLSVSGMLYQKNTYQSWPDSVEEITRGINGIIVSGSSYSLGCTDRDSCIIPSELAFCSDLELDKKIEDFVKESKAKKRLSDSAKKGVKTRREKETLKRLKKKYES